MLGLAAGAAIWTLTTETYGLVGAVLGLWAASIGAWIVGFLAFLVWNRIAARMERRAAQIGARVEGLPE